MLIVDMDVYFLRYIYKQIVGNLLIDCMEIKRCIQEECFVVICEVLIIGVCKLWGLWGYVEVGMLEIVIEVGVMWGVMYY